MLPSMIIFKIVNVFIVEFKSLIPLQLTEFSFFYNLQFYQFFASIFKQLVVYYIQYSPGSYLFFKSFYILFCLLYLTDFKEIDYELNTKCHKGRNINAKYRVHQVPKEHLTLLFVGQSPQPNNKDIYKLVKIQHSRRRK